MKKVLVLAFAITGLAGISTYLWKTRKPSAIAVRFRGQIPIVFEANEGQSAPGVAMLAHVKGNALYLQRDGVVMALRQAGETTLTKLEFAGANAAAEIHGEAATASRSNYFVGKDRRAWKPNVANYARARYTGIYPGTDVVFHGEGGTLEYDFWLAPGADPGAIRIRLVGTQKFELTPAGDVLLQNGDTKILQHHPVAYQRGMWGKTEVASRYVLRENGEMGIELGEYDHRKDLVIDPVLTYATYLGGNGDDASSAIAVDGQGFAYITGQTVSTNFPVANAFQGSCGGNCVAQSADAFVTKLSADGKSIVYSTYLGGNNLDIGRAIVVDTDGNAYVAGLTSSADFPTTTGAFQTACNSHACQSAFVSKLNAAGNQLVYSTYLGGSTPSEDARGIALDSSRHAYVTGITSSSDFPTTPGAYDTVCGTHGECSSFIGDAFVSKLSVDGSALDYSTFLGGGSGDEGNAIAVDSAGRAYVAGRTFSTDFPVTGGAPQAAFGGGNTDAFVARLTADGSGLDYSTYLGGSVDEQANGVAVDGDSNTYVTGTTNSQDFPTVPGSMQTFSTGLPDAFVTKITQAGRGFVYSTYLGGQLSETGDAIAVTPNGNAYVAGSTMSSGFPVFSPTQASCNTCGNLFSTGYVTKLTADGSKPVFSTFIGGSFQDAARGIAVDANGDAYVAGLTDSTDFPTTPGAFQGTRNTPGDGFVAKMSGLRLPVVTNPVTVVNFPIPQLVGTTSSQPEVLTLQNVGDGTLNIGGMTASTSYGVTNNCNGSVPGPGSCAITITFTPATAGVLGGQVTITDDAADSPQTIQMSGTGVDFSLAPASGGSNTASVTAGGTAKYKLSVVPAGFSGQVSLSCNQAPPHGTCVVTPASVPLDGTNPAAIEVDVTTTGNAGLASPVGGAQTSVFFAVVACLLFAHAIFLLIRMRWETGLQPSFRGSLLAAAGTIVLGVTLVAGCGGGSSSQPKGTPTGTYNLTVTGTGGGGSRNLPLHLTVN